MKLSLVAILAFGVGVVTSQLFMKSPPSEETIVQTKSDRDAIESQLQESAQNNKNTAEVLAPEERLKRAVKQLDALSTNETSATLDDAFQAILSDPEEAYRSERVQNFIKLHNALMKENPNAFWNWMNQIENEKELLQFWNKLNRSYQWREASEPYADQYFEKFLQFENSHDQRRLLGKVLTGIANTDYAKAMSLAQKHQGQVSLPWEMGKMALSIGEAEFAKFLSYTIGKNMGGYGMNMKFPDEFDYSTFANEWRQHALTIEDGQRVSHDPGILDDWIERDPQSALDFVIEMHDLRKGKSYGELFSLDTYLEHYAKHSSPEDWHALVQEFQTMETFEDGHLTNAINSSLYSNQGDMLQTIISADQYSGAGYRRKLLLQTYNSKYQYPSRIPILKSYPKEEQLEIIAGLEGKARGNEFSMNQRNFEKGWANTLTMLGYTAEEITEFKSSLPQ